MHKVYFVIFFFVEGFDGLIFCCGVVVCGEVR